MHGKREREKLARATSALLASCMGDVMAELTELVGIMDWMKKSREEIIGRDGRARGCS
jgi:hypothetical protein